MSEQDLLALAREQFKHDEDDESALREEYRTNTAFICGDQWDERIKQQRLKAGRPVLTFPRMHTFVQQVANEARQNKSEIKFIPTEDNDKETAEIREGLARHIQYNSRAKIAFETAAECAAGGGYGFFRFLPDYCDDKTLDQEINVVPVFDPLSVYGVLIPSCFGIEPDHAFVVEEMPKAVYKRRYPKSEAALDFDAMAGKSEGWIGTETVRVAEWWRVEESTETLEVGGKTRPVTKKLVKYCTINGVEILPDTETEYLGKRIPIFTVLGKLIFDQGKPRLFSVVSYQRDPQKLINMYKTRIAETLGTAPIQPYLVASGAIPPEARAAWETLNTQQRPYLEYNAYDASNGQVIPPPQRQVFEAPIGALSEAAAQEIDDLKATSGIFDASLGSRSNESSGVAIQRRQQQSNITNMHFLDNLERAFEESGQELAYIIPKYYDAARQVRILGRDETPKIVRINEAYNDETGKARNYRVGGDAVSKYDVIVTMGRSFSTKRLESFDMMSQVMQANPQQFPMWADIFFKNSDMAGADQLAERFKKMLPPNLQDQENDDPEAKVNALQSQLQALSQQHEQLVQALNEANQAIDSKQVDAQAKIQLAQMQEETKRLIETNRLEFERWKVMHSSAHEMAKQNDQQEFDAEMQNRADIAAQQQAEMQPEMTDGEL